MKNSALTRRIVVLLIGILMSAAAEFAVAQLSGGGTEDSPYLIDDVDDLETLAGDSAYYGGYVLLTADIDCAGRNGMNLIIARDTDNSNGEYDGPAFTGTFDGNYHVVRNLSISPGSNEDYLGLFGMIDSDAHVMNLGVVNTSVTCGATSNAVGVLAGANSGTVENCYTTGVINGGATSLYLGGLVGVNAFRIYNCYANVEANGGASSQYVGGFVGMNMGLAYNCYAGGTAVGQSFVGGFAGDNYFLFGAIGGCYFLHPSDGGGPINGLGAPLTEEQMSQQNSFAGWDFFGEDNNGIAETWSMAGFPALSWQIPVGLREFAMLSQYWQTTDCPADTLCETVDWYIDHNIDMRDLLQLVASWLERVVVTDRLHIGDDFETGDFSNMPWVMGGDADWVIDPVNPSEGSFSARSGDIDDSQTTSLEFTADTTDYDAISFYMKVSTESGRDKLFFYEDGDSHGLFYGDGELDWTQFTFDVSSGSHVFKWVYVKDSSGSSGDDAVWIDKIEFVILD